MVEMHGPIAGLVQQDFEDSWSGTNGTAKHLPEESETDTRLLTDTQSDEAIVAFAQKQISQAERRIWLETPYIDMPNVGTMLMEAKKRNPSLDVQVIIPRFNNSPSDRLRTSRIVRTLGEAGIEAHKYGKTYRRLNHAKLLFVDDMVMFGSSNFNISSLAGNNAEIEVATRNPGVVAQLERWYAEDLNETVND